MFKYILKHYIIFSVQFWMRKNAGWDSSNIYHSFEFLCGNTLFLYARRGDLSLRFKAMQLFISVTQSASLYSPPFLFL